MHNIENSDVVKHVLFSLVNVTSEKSSKDYAWSIIKNLIKELRTNYDFLKHIKINDLKSLNNTIDDINVGSDLNKVDSRDIGRAIQNIIDVFKTRMGSRAGYFFIQEFRNIIGEDLNEIIKKMGVDLRLSELQNELSGMNTTEYKIKDDREQNIAFLERNEN